jgi:hypothetical protein
VQLQPAGTTVQAMATTVQSMEPLGAAVLPAQELPSTLFSW